MDNLNYKYKTKKNLWLLATTEIIHHLMMIIIM